MGVYTSRLFSGCQDGQVSWRPDTTVLLSRPAVHAAGQHLKGHRVRWLRIEFFYFSLMNFYLNSDSWQRYCTVDPRPLCSRSWCLTVGHGAAGGYSALPLPHWWAVRWWGNLPLQVLQGRQFKMWIYSTHKQRILWESLRALHVSSPQSLAAPHLTRPDHSLPMRRASIWQGTVHSRDCNSKYIRSI